MMLSVKRVLYRPATEFIIVPRNEVKKFLKKHIPPAHPPFLLYFYLIKHVLA